MNNSNILNITLSLTGWPAAVTCGTGILVIGGVIVFLGSRLIDNGYQLTNANGVSITFGNRGTSGDTDDAANRPQPLAA